MVLAVLGLVIKEGTWFSHYVVTFQLLELGIPPFIQWQWFVRYCH
jgi:hypothetical protein